MNKKVVLIRSRSIDSAIFKLADTLFKNGYAVHLLVWDRQNNLQEKDYPYKITKFNLKAPYDKYQALLYLPLWWIYEFIFLLKNDSDIIHACDLDTLWPAIIIKKIKRVPLLYTIYDFYANNLIDGTFQPLRNFIRYFFSSIEKLGIKFTDILYIADKSREEEVKGAKIKKLVHIYNTPPDYKNFNNKRVTSKFSIFFGGLLIENRGIQHVIQSIKDLEDVELIIAGTGKCKDEIKKSSEKYDNIEYLGWLPSYDDIIRECFKSDILFRFNDPKVPKTKFESPNKLFEAMMCKKPIIVNDRSAMADIVKEENCGVVVPYGDIKLIRDAIIRLRDDEQLRFELGKNGRNAYQKKYSWSIMEGRIINSYEEVLNAK